MVGILPPRQHQPLPQGMPGPLLGPTKPGKGFLILLGKQNTHSRNRVRNANWPSLYGKECGDSSIN